MPSWTNDQKRAINEAGGKIIVSAAAGSGKTAVLSQRVVKHVLNHVGINELLVVTFTNMAALEMRQRIKQNISEALKLDPDNEFLKDQVSLTSIADITTMDAFYNTIVRENFEKLNIRKDYGILGEQEELILKEKVVEKVMEEAFDKVRGYTNLLDNFSSFKTDLIKSIIFKVSDFLDTTAFKDEFISKSIGLYDDGNDFYKDYLISQVKDNMQSYLSVYDDLISSFAGDDAFSKVLLIASGERNMIKGFLDVRNLDDLSNCVRLSHFEVLRSSKDINDSSLMLRYKVIRDDLKAYIKKDLDEFRFINEEVYKKEKQKLGDLSRVLFEVVGLFDDALMEEKRRINKYSFSDVAHFVIELLIKDGKKTPLASELSKRYKEILIDEYQDTNNLQNVIFNAISNDGKNLFIVGDVKQSIYKFRSACPQIFNDDKRNAFKDRFPKLITLSKNFRSRKEVLDFCNFVFLNTMSVSFGEVDYNEDEMLYLGTSFDERNDVYNDVYIIDGKEDKDDLENDLNKTQKEAILVANKVKELLDLPYMVYDAKSKTSRKITENDIVILLRSLKNSNVFKEALTKRKINVYMDSSLEYFDNYEVKIVIDFLKVIDNPLDDNSLLAVLNASFTEFDLNYITDLCTSYNDKYLYDKLLRKKDDVSLKFVNKLNKIRCFSACNTLYDTLVLLYKEFDVINVISAYQDGNRRKKNLIQMVNHAVSFEQDGKKTLHEFVIYLNDVILNKASLSGVNPLSSSNNVLITTIHKSKGLEYPVVVLAETGKGFNFKDLNDDVLISDDACLALNFRDDDNFKYETIPVMVFKQMDKNKMLSEELRILYVALTRAKEKVIITGYSNNVSNLVLKASSKMGDNELVSGLYLKKVRSFLDVLMPCLLRYNKKNDLDNYLTMRPKTFFTESKINVRMIDAKCLDESEFLEKNKVVKENFDHDWYQKLSSYDNLPTLVPRYLSVSEIKKDKTTLTRTPSFMKDGVSGSYKGMLYHRILELLPVKRYGVKTLKDAINDLVLAGKINSSDLKLINLDKIFSYLTSFIYDLVLESKVVYKEYHVNFKIPASYYDNSLKSGNILTSGVIDLLFLHDGYYYVVDYKTDDVESVSLLLDRYKVQLDLYEVAIKEKFKTNKVKKFIYSIKFGTFIQL